MYKITLFVSKKCGIFMAWETIGLKAAALHFGGATLQNPNEEGGIAMITYQDFSCSVRSSLP